MELSGNGYIIAVTPKTKRYEEEDKQDFNFVLVEIAGMGFCETAFAEEGFKADVDDETLVKCNFKLKKGRLLLKTVESLPEKNKK